MGRKLTEVSQNQYFAKVSEKVNEGILSILVCFIMIMLFSTAAFSQTGPAGVGTSIGTSTLH